MTLEDFFTLTEIKDGLSAPSRVHELVAVMQKEKDSVVNVGDTIRQWAAVASTLAATENKDCLDLFIQLDGLLFIDKWLKDAQSFDNDTGDGLIEESISALLTALEKLQIDKERSISSGIWITVNSLLDHNSTRIQDRARSVFNGWKQGRLSDSISCDIQSVKAPDDTNSMSGSSKAECVAVDTVLSKGSTDVETNAAESEAGGTLQSEERYEEMKTETHSKELCSPKVSDHGKTEDRTSDTLTTATVANSMLESSLSYKTSVASTEGGNASVERENFQPESDPSNKISSSLDSSDEMASASFKGELSTTTVQEAGRGTSFQKNIDEKEGDLSAGTSSFLGIRVGSTHCPSETLKDLSGTEKKFEKLEDEQTGDLEAFDEYRERSSEGADDVSEGSDFAEPATFAQISNQNDRSSDIDLECGIFDDALKVARQIAREAEREVVDQREPSCGSSSEECMEADVRQPGTPDSGKHSPPSDVPSDTPRQTQSAEGGFVRERQLINPDNQNEESKASVQDQDSSQLTEMVQELEGGKEPCGFDLNQELCSDETDRHVNTVSTPSVVSASRLVAASVSPGAPLQFEASLGWRSSVTTGAFHPASPRGTTDGDKNPEMGGSSSSSKQRQDSLDIDLNVAEDGYEKITNTMTKRRLSISSGIQSGESSLEVGTKRSGTPNLDLNRMVDDSDAPPPDLRIKEHLFYLRNDQRSPSPVSSSPSMQSSLRNFDLNDRPLFLNNSSDQGLFHDKSSQNANAYEAGRLGEPVISIMGTKVEVGNRAENSRKDFISHTRSSNGKPFDMGVTPNMARMGGFLAVAPPVTYGHSPVYGYNGLAAGSTLSMAPAMYGPGGSIPYMVDSRGAPVMPQIMGSASAIPPYTHQPPFIMSMPPPGLNGAGPSRPSFDLNSGFAIDGGSAGGLRPLQLFMPSQGRSVEDLRANSQPFSGAVVTGKRKMPDGGWEPYSLHYKHMQPP